MTTTMMCMEKTKLKEYFEPQQNRRYEVCRFRQVHQRARETLDQFRTRLQTLAQTYSFRDLKIDVYGKSL